MTSGRPDLTSSGCRSRSRRHRSAEDDKSAGFTHLSPIIIIIIIYK